VINGELQSGEKVVPAKLLREWGIVLPTGWTVTIRPDRFDLGRSPLDFDPGVYSAHDYAAFLARRLTFIVVTAEVREGKGNLANVEVDGIAWRQAEPRSLYVGDADVDALLSEGDRRELAANAVAAAEREAGR
jgi:hypothetical protein